MDLWNTAWHLLCAILLLKSQANAFNNLRIGSYNETHEEFINRLLKGYNKKLRPGLESEVMDTIEIGLYVKTISSVDTEHMQFSVGMILYQWWQDNRFNYSSIYNGSLILSYYFDKIWTPDTFFVNEKEGIIHTVTHENRFLKVKPNGLVLLAQKLTVKLSCHMDLYYFPHDTQHCYADISSFGYPKRELKFLWHRSKVSLNKHLELPEFKVAKVETGDCVNDNVNGRFTCINAIFVLERDSGYYVIQTYIPTIIFVMLSWSNFYMDPKAVPARVALGLLAVLAITTKQSSAVTQLPKVSYVKAIDVWMSVCLTFVLLAFVEYCVVHYVLCVYEESEQEPKVMRVVPQIQHGAQEEGVRKMIGDTTETSYSNKAFQLPPVENGMTKLGSDTSTQQPPRHSRISPTDAMRPLTDTRRKKKRWWTVFQEKRPLSATIDFWSRVAFPVAFIVFNMYYWIRYPLWL